MLYNATALNWLGGRVVMQRPAKPFTPVRFRLQPPLFFEDIFIYKSIIVSNWYQLTCPSGGIGRHKGLKIPR